jgi:hypothetical protein
VGQEELSLRLERRSNILAACGVRHAHKRRQRKGNPNPIRGESLAAQRAVRQKGFWVWHARTVNVFLGAVDDANVATTQRQQLVGEDFARIGAFVHEVQLGDHAHRAETLPQEG